MVIISAIEGAQSKRFEKFVRLCNSFPVLRHCAPREALTDQGVDFIALDDWAMREDPDGSEGVLSTVQFVLGVWSSGHPWKVGAFDLFRALRVWDDEQLFAWKLWAVSPWTA